MSTSVACKTEQQRQQQMIFVLVLEKKSKWDRQETYIVTVLITHHFYSPNTGELKVLKKGPYLLFFMKKSNICHAKQGS